MSGRRRILVTRAEPGASTTAVHLAERGYATAVEPLFRLVSMAATLPPFDALAFTSANGARTFAALWQERAVPVFTVGARTAEVAREVGFRDVVSAGRDVEALALLIESELPPAARLLHTGNEESRGDLAGVLTASGREAAFVATYRAEPVSQPGPALAAHLAGQPSFDAVLIHSPRGAAVLKGFLDAAPAHAPVSAAAISANTADALGPVARVEIAETPDEESLLRALARLFS